MDPSYEQDYLQEGGKNNELDMQGGAKKRLSKKQHCAPGSKMEAGSCMNKDLIKKVARAMNSVGKKRKKYKKINLSLPCYKIHAEICKNLEEVDDCKSEACLLFKDDILQKLSPRAIRDFEFSFQPPMDEDMLTSKVKKKKIKKQGKTVHKPHAKEDENAWLSNKNITDACIRDEAMYPEYAFFGAEPIDFSDCKVSMLCKFNQEEHRKQGKTKLGFVFNTDPHDEDGEHWISMYIDLMGHNLPDNPAIYYFDSYGREPPDEIDEFIKKCQDISDKEKKHKPLRYFYNDKDFQKSGAQCGMYAIHFLREMAKGRGFKEYLNQNPTNAKMKQLRPIYFVSPEDV